MNRLISLLVFVTSSIVSPRITNAQEYWQRRYGAEESSNLGHFIRPTSDGNYIVMAGYTISSHPWLLKVDPYGDTIWSRIYDDEDLYWDDIFCVQEAQDGGFVMTGLFSKPDDRGLLVAKTDSGGDIKWTCRYRYEDPVLPYENNYGVFVEPTEDGGYIVAGRTGGGPWIYGNPWLLKLDSMGDTMWTRIYGDKDEKFWGQSVRQLDDGGYIVLAARGVYILEPDEPEDTWLVRTDSLGDTLWTKLIEGVGSWSIETVDDGGFILVGQTVGGYADLCIARTDENGDTLWVRSYGKNFTDKGYWIEQTSDGGFIAIGQGYTDFPSGSNAKALWILKLNQDGDTIWTRFYGGLYWDWGSCLCQTPDNGFLLVGQTDSWSSGYEDYELWLLKVDSLGLGITPELSAYRPVIPDEYEWIKKMNPRCEFANISPEPSENFYANAKIFSLPRYDCIYHDSVLVDTSLQTCQDINIVFQEWNAPEYSEYEILFYPTSSSYDTLITDSSAVKFYYDDSSIDEYFVAERQLRLLTTVGPEIMMQYFDCPKGYRITFYDISGCRVDEIHFSDISGICFWGKDHVSGVYFMKFNTGGVTYFEKVILIR